ncbi:flagellar hook-basal body protein [Terriglobus sp.]|uniref:flagellar hook-basal body protein n=1 Tax=Terriglobus sp. TaxID=1889013 RepID=UPI003AFFB6D9
MDSGLYAAYTGVLARTQALDTAANNLANASTNGFRAQRDYFRGVLAGIAPESDSSGTQDSVNRFGLLGGSQVDLSQGLVASTGNPLDLALEGQGFFQVKTAHGVELTRDGSFLRGADGTLTDQKGEAVLSKLGAPLVLPSGSVHVSADGTVSVDTANGSAVAGEIGIVSYAATDLKPVGANHFRVATDAKPTAPDATVQQGSLEGANQDAVHGTMQLMMLQRQAEMMQHALSVFDNGFDKTAAEELGRV